MANYAENVLNIIGPENDRLKFRDTVNTKISPFDFHALVPCPSELTGTGVLPEVLSESNSSSPDSRSNAGWFCKKEAGEWCRRNWGTRYAPSDDEVKVTMNGATLQYRFWTRSAPPHAFLLSASKLFPTLTFTLDFAEEGCNYSGHYEVKAGVVRKNWSGDYTPFVWHPEETANKMLADKMLADSEDEDLSNKMLKDSSFEDFVKMLKDSEDEGIVKILR